MNTKNWTALPPATRDKVVKGIGWLASAGGVPEDGCAAARDLLLSAAAPGHSCGACSTWIELCEAYTEGRAVDAVTEVRRMKNADEGMKCPIGRFMVLALESAGLL